MSISLQENTLKKKIRKKKNRSVITIMDLVERREFNQVVKAEAVGG